MKQSAESCLVRTCYIRHGGASWVVDSHFIVFLTKYSKFRGPFSCSRWTKEKLMEAVNCVLNRRNVNPTTTEAQTCESLALWEFLSCMNCDFKDLNLRCAVTTENKESTVFHQIDSLLILGSFDFLIQKHNIMINSSTKRRNESESQTTKERTTRDFLG